MSGSTSAHHNISHGPNTWAGASASGSLTTSLTDTLSQPRTQYQPGYMMVSLHDVLVWALHLHLDSLLHKGM
jgi:hypothetical protein